MLPLIGAANIINYKAQGILNANLAGGANKINKEGSGNSISVKDKDNAQQVWGNILNFARDFPQKELGVMLVSDMQRAIGEEIFAIPEFANWASKIADTLFD
jgi:hypothetical protein